MKVLKETDEHLELGCEVCLAEKIFSVQVISRPKAWARAKWENETRGIQMLNRRAARIRSISYAPVSGANRVNGVNHAK